MNIQAVPTRIHYVISLVLAVAAGAYFSVLPLEQSIAGLFGVSLVVSAFLSPIAMLIILLVIAPLRTLVATEAPFSLPLDPGQMLFGVVVGCWLLNRLLQRNWTIRWQIPFVLFPIGLFALSNMLSLVAAVSVGAWMIELLKWVVIVIIVVIVIDLRPSVEWLVFGLVLAACVNAFIGIYIFFGGSGALHLLVNDRFFRAFGTFGQPNPFGGFMGMTAPLAMMMAYGKLRRGIKHRTSYDLFISGLWVIASLLLVIGLFISWSRGAWLGFAAATTVMIVLLPRKLWQSMIVFLGLCAIGLTAWQSGYVPATISDRIGSATEELFTLNDVRAVDITALNYPVVERLAHWQAALNMSRDQFWLGVGAGNYEVVYDDYRLLNWREPLGHAHNFYLNVFAETGIIGLCIYVLLWISIIWFTVTVIKHHPNLIRRSIGIGLMGTWTYFLIHSLTDNLIVNNLFIHLGAMLGIVALLHNEIRGISFDGLKNG